MRTWTRIPLQAVALGALLAPAALAAASPARAGTADDLKEKYEQKLKKSFVAHGGWITDYDQARQKAKAEGKVLFVYFSRSFAP